MVPVTRNAAGPAAVATTGTIVLTSKVSSAAYPCGGRRLPMTAIPSGPVRPFAATVTAAAGAPTAAALATVPIATVPIATAPMTTDAAATSTATLGSRRRCHRPT